jgi:hypothetical protein
MFLPLSGDCGVKHISYLMSLNDVPQINGKFLDIKFKKKKCAANRAGKV